MISASLAVEGLSGHGGHAYPPTPPEFLRPLPRPAPYARYPPRAAPASQAPAPTPTVAQPPTPPAPDDSLYSPYARFLAHSLPFAPYATAPYVPPHPVSVPQPPTPYRQLQLRSGFVPPVPPPAPVPAPVQVLPLQVQPVHVPPCLPPDAGSPPAGNRGFKIPSGKEGSLKHRLLNRRREEQFSRGALIRLDNGQLRRVQDVRTEDFVQSADTDPEHRLADSTIVKLCERLANGTVALTLSYSSNRARVDMEVPLEHPFFVYGQGWASCYPERTMQCYGLQVNKLQVGDVCISLTPRTKMERSPPITPLVCHSMSSKTSTIITTATTTAMTVRPTDTITPQTQPENLSLREDSRKRRWSAPDICDEDQKGFHPSKR